jgi:hypothetical protein
VRDAGATLCVAVGAGRDERNCREPTPRPFDALIAISRDERVVGGALDPLVASVDVRSSDGSHRRIPTDPGSGYAGRYAGLMRFFSASASPGAVLDSMELRDASGHLLFRWPLRFDAERVGRPERLVSGRAPGGRFELTQSRFRLPLLKRPFRCLAVTRPGRTVSDPFRCLALTERGKHLDTRSLNGIVRCDLRAAIMVGGASREAASVRVRMADGSTAAGRLFQSALGRAFLIVAPPDRTMRDVEVLDRAGTVLRRFTARIPPARRQCGYSFGRSADSARSVAVRPAVPSRAWQPYPADHPVRLTADPWRRR